MKKCGIYKITNTKNNWYYIGSSLNIICRFGNHKYCLRRNNHTNPKLQNAWNKYGEKSFVFEIVELCDPKKIIDLEQKYLDKLYGRKNIYNIVFVVGRFPDSSGDKNPRWINVNNKEKNIIKKYWIKNHTVKTIEFIKKRFGYGGSVARRIIKEIKSKLNIPNHTKDNNIYTFLNTKTKEKFIGTRKDFLLKFNVGYVSVSELILGKVKCNRKGWTIL